MKKRNQLDAKDTVFFERELNSVQTKVYQKSYPALKMASGTLIPITSEADIGAETISYKMYDRTGIAEMIESYANDLPLSDVTGTEEFAKIKGFGLAYNYSIQEIRRAAMTGTPLQSMKAVACRTGIEERTDRIGWFGHPEGGLYGLLSNPNIPVTLNTGNRISGATTTPKEMYDLLADAVNDMIDLTNGVEVPDTLLLPIKEYGIIAKTKMDSGTDTTVLQFFLQNFPFMAVEWGAQLKGVSPRPSGSAGSTECMVVYRKDSEKIRFEIPSVFQQEPAEKRNLAYVVDCHSRVAGVITQYPLSISIKENI